MKKISVILFFLSCLVLSAREYHPDAMRDEVDFLCGPRFAGRASGTNGCRAAGQYIYQAFRAAGLDVAVQQVNGYGTNIIAEVPGRSGVPTIVVMAYYDGLGAGPSGEFYPGADSNASGVVALLELARAFADAPKTDYNYLFVALDCHNVGLRGARALAAAIENATSLEGPVIPGRRLGSWNGYAVRVGTTPYAGHKYTVKLPGSALSGRNFYSGRNIFVGKCPGNIKMVVNLDTIGSTLAPGADGRTDYLLALGGKTWSKQLEDCNGGGPGLKLYFDYYGSQSFTRMFYNMRSDHKFLLDKGLPCIMFTSGITFNTNHESDTPSSLNYPVMVQRLDLIETWLRTF